MKAEAVFSRLTFLKIEHKGGAYGRITENSLSSCSY